MKFNGLPLVFHWFSMVSRRCVVWRPEVAQPRKAQKSHIVKEMIKETTRSKSQERFSAVKIRRSSRVDVEQGTEATRESQLLSDRWNSGQPSGNTYVSQWCLLCFPIVLLSLPNGFAMVLLWFSNGFAMVFQCFCNGFAVVAEWTPFIFFKIINSGRGGHSGDFLKN